MPVYTIFRKYQIAAKNVSDATKKLLEAVELKKDEDYHISDSVREADEQPKNGHLASWTNSAKKQLFGK